jgi:cysteine desulfurase/selenocysteine lyase
MLEYYHEYRANVERGVYKASQLATNALEKARGEIARLINAKPEEIILVRNTSEGINLVASGLGLKKEDRIVTTILEHHSNFIVWLRARDRVGAEVKVIMSNNEGFLEPSDFDMTINDRTKIVAVTQTSNVLGVRPPVKEIINIAHNKDALVLLDGAQSVPHMRVDVRAMECDFLAFSGHKMFGPTGAGALYIREDLQDKIEPLCIGGGSIEDVGIDYYRLRRGPTGFEAGTPPIAEVIGMGAAASYLMGIGISNIVAHDALLTNRMLKGLVEVPKLTLYGPKGPKDRAGIFSFNLGKLHPHDLAIALDATAGIMVRSGHHCALPLHKYILKAEQGTVRASVYIYNTEQDVDVLLSTLSEISNTML